MTISNVPAPDSAEDHPAASVAPPTRAAAVGMLTPLDLADLEVSLRMIAGVRASDFAKTALVPFSTAARLADALAAATAKNQSTLDHRDDRETVRILHYPAGDAVLGVTAA